MGAESLAELVAEVKAASAAFERGDSRTNERIDTLERSVNNLMVKVQRPGAEATGASDNDLIRKDAHELCILKHQLTVPKNDGMSTYSPSPSEIDEATAYRCGLQNLWRVGDANRFDATIRKSMSSFSFGTNQFLMPPQLSNQILSCIVDPTDVTGLVNVVQISAPSIQFMIDNSRLSVAAWGCESNCFANNPAPDLQAGIGTMEIKAETLRFIQCATNDLLADASINVEAWIVGKVTDGFRVAINNAILGGDGLGRPMGILNPNAGIPIMDTSVNTPPGQ